MALARTCLGCGAYVRGRSRCVRCSNTAVRGYGWSWQQRARALVAEHPYCSWCGSTSDLTVDHVVPKSKGGTDDRANCRVLCRVCNSTRPHKARES